MEVAETTPKDQITVPVARRKSIKLKDGGKVLYIRDGDRYHVEDAVMITVVRSTGWRVARPAAVRHFKRKSGGKEKSLDCFVPRNDGGTRLGHINRRRARRHFRTREWT
jgi:bifunctional DNA-binding transcriptional regulator/antitoxin component of YhaV-PrlF toxin-antitoxin module